MHYEPEEMEIDLREIFFVIKKRIVAIILAGILLGGSVFAFNYFVSTPVYESTAKLYIQTQSTSITSLADIQMSTVLARDYVEFIQSRTLCQEVIDNLGLSISWKELKSSVTVTNPEDTRILYIAVKGTDPEQTTEIANELATVSKRQISKIMNTDEPSLWEVAIVPSSPVKPEKAKNAVLGFMVGAFLAAIISIVMYLFDDAIYTPDDIERRLGLNTLVSISEGNTKGKRKKKKNKIKKVKSKKDKKKDK